MQVITDYSEIDRKFPNPIVTIGNFDGVHLGHQFLLNSVVQEAIEQKGTSVVVTFWPHPGVFFSEDQNFLCIQSLEQRIASIKALGVDVLLIQPFDLAFSQLSPLQFIQNCILGALAPSKLIIGYDFCFGYKKSGSFEDIRAATRGIPLEVLHGEPCVVNDRVVSSNFIRGLLMEKNFSAAERLLGKPYTYSGNVVRGHGRGKQIGFATANLSSSQKICLPNGVYAGITQYSQMSFMSVVNVGVAPTFSNKIKSIEVHLLDFEKDIYDERLSVDFKAFIRAEQCFSSVENLTKQIERDIHLAYSVLASSSNT